MIFEKSDRVMTPGGAGVVIYKRYSHLNSTFQTVAAYSIMLDSRKNDIDYTATIYPAEVVKEI